MRDGILSAAAGVFVAGISGLLVHYTDSFSPELARPVFKTFGTIFIAIGILIIFWGSIIIMDAIDAKRRKA